MECGFESRPWHRAAVVKLVYTKFYLTITLFVNSVDFIYWVGGVNGLALSLQNC